MASRCCVCECGTLKKLTALYLYCPRHKFVWCMVHILCQDTGFLNWDLRFSSLPAGNSQDCTSVMPRLLPFKSYILRQSPVILPLTLYSLEHWQCCKINHDCTSKLFLFGAVCVGSVDTEISLQCSFAIIWAWIMVWLIFYVYWSVHRCDGQWNEEPTRCYLVLFITLTICSICFGYLYAHHQKLQ
jgi:hypothetical protein